MAEQHQADGSDHSGRDLAVTIRIGPDGSLYFHDLTADLLPIALALCPQDLALAARAAAAAGFGQERAQ
jgi:hypothetical protein